MRDGVGLEAFVGGACSGVVGLAGLEPFVSRVSLGVFVRGFDGRGRSRTTAFTPCDGAGAAGAAVPLRPGSTGGGW
jgi:hypothetical protein